MTNLFLQTYTHMKYLMLTMIYVYEVKKITAHLRSRSVVLEGI